MREQKLKFISFYFFHVLQCKSISYKNTVYDLDLATTTQVHENYLRLYSKTSLQANSAPTDRCIDKYKIYSEQLKNEKVILHLSQKRHKILRALLYLYYIVILDDITKCDLCTRPHIAVRDTLARTEQWRVDTNAGERDDADIPKGTVCSTRRLSSY